FRHYNAVEVLSRRIEVGNEDIDASLGLAFSLELFALYKRSGKLQAGLQRFPGIKGQVTASLSLVEGTVVSCILEDKGGQQHPISKDALIRFDTDKGPFEWNFHALSPKPTPAQMASPPVQPISPRY